MCAYILTTFCQNNADSIKLVKFNKGFRYQQAESVLNSSDLKYVLSTNKVSLKYLRQSMILDGFANSFIYTGGFCIGYPLGYAIAKGQMNWSLFAMGCGFGILGIPILIASDHKFKIAINAYNGFVKPKPASNQMHVNLSCTQNGVGFTLTL